MNQKNIFAERKIDDQGVDLIFTIRLILIIFFLSLASSASLHGQSLGLTGLTPIQFKCGEAISPSFQVQLRDAMGNPDLMAGVNITATVSAGSGMVSSGGSVNTDANGIA
ncbi:MAG: hypothetical protein HRU40_18995, partial [Saprospiraceae bacterium]|nr:hypothetical protein [Saprospiraceae bacterium]